jgi:hypothetical protein
LSKIGLVEWWVPKRGKASKKSITPVVFLSALQAGAGAKKLKKIECFGCSKFSESYQSNFF